MISFIKAAHRSVWTRAAPSGSIEPVSDLCYFTKEGIMGMKVSLISRAPTCGCETRQVSAEWDVVWQVFPPGYLLTDEGEGPVLSDALVGLPQHRVKGLVAVPERRGGVAGDRKGSNVNLWEMKSKNIERSLH